MVDRFAGGRTSCSVLVDAHAWNPSGIGRYLREIISGLLVDPRFTTVVLLGSTETAKFFADSERVEKLRVEAYPEGFYTPRTQLAWLARRARGGIQADVSFFPHYDAPLVGLPDRSVVTVHDLIHFKVPEAFPAWRRMAAGMLFDRVVSGASRVIAVSDSTRRDIVERIPTAAAKVETVPNGVSPFFRPVPASEQPGLASLCPFLLCVGNRKPHKNWIAAVEALALLKAQQPRLRLVFAGRAFGGWEKVLGRADELGVRGALVELNEIDDGSLRWLYSHCEALLFPSLYEGFGLPVLEAMACGAPVIASDRSSLPEIVGNAGLTINPNDYRAIAHGVLGLWREVGLRHNLVSSGFRRAAGFSWKCAAERTADILYRVATREV